MAKAAINKTRFFEVLNSELPFCFYKNEQKFGSQLAISVDGNRRENETIVEAPLKIASHSVTKQKIR